MRATISNLHYDHAAKAFEGRVRIIGGNGTDDFTARAYLPILTARQQVEAALIRVAELRAEARAAEGPEERG